MAVAAQRVRAFCNRVIVGGQVYVSVAGDHEVDVVSIDHVVGDVGDSALTGADWKAVGVLAGLRVFIGWAGKVGLLWNVGGCWGWMCD